MMHFRFLSIILGLLLVMASALAHQDDKATGKGLLASTKGYIVSSREELVHGVASINMRKLRLQGRKMAEHKVSGEKFEKDDDAQQRKNSEISGATTRSDGKCDFEGRRDFCVERKIEDNSSSTAGKSCEASKKSLERSHHRADDQKTKTLNSEPAAVLLSSSKPIQSQDSKTLRTKASLKGSPRSDNEVSQELDDTDDQTVDTQRLLVATKEIVNLMNKDYRGMPRRKPPINNDEPRH
ncbi:hypothetical protein Patl1_21590 [Pistacia atlantica]|uniref:Uncharacterized protein n=1 Tax=Pistacia atlantica TaxID=434234 RepID=A0ACC1BMP8_9ROSI|nr:hypothetical protein Patl1_21590 [Pistacia atlantica]